MKMLKWCTWLLCLAAVTLADRSPGILRDSSFLPLLNKDYNSAYSPRSQWDHLRGDTYGQASEFSHSYGIYPIKTTGSSSEHPVYALPSSGEYWKPNSSNTTYTGASYYGYRTRPGATSAASSYQDLLQGSHSAFQHQIRPAVGNKKPSPYAKGNLQVQSYDLSGKAKYKYKFPPMYKQTVYPRVHKPYVKHKYPARNTVNPLYKSYYQSQYQKYAIPSRYKLTEGLYKPSTASPSTASDRYHTTERMDDAYPDGTSEDYSTYNYTHPYETYEEVEKTTSEPEEIAYDESTTRNYYGDRIYMSTQVPLVTSEKTGVRNKYFIIRRTANDDDIETIFE